MQPRGLVSFWLGWMHRLAGPLAKAGLSPALVSLSGLGFAVLGAVAAACSIPGRFSWAALAVALAGLADGLDGAVAVLQRRDGRPGALLDAVCDRVCDLLFVLTLWLAGAPATVCCAVAVVFLLHEYIRAVARSVGLREDTVITVAERPTRVILTAAFLLAAGTAGSWPLDMPGVAGAGRVLELLAGPGAGPLSAAAFWPALGAWSALVIAAIGMAQLVAWLGRSLRHPASRS